MEIGGWSDNQTMHKIYTHISHQDVNTHAQQLIAFFTSQKQENGDKNDDEKEKV